MTNENKWIGKNGKNKNTQKPHLKNCNLLIAQDLWQAHYQFLLIRNS